jgi:PleD family two-component response regulator
LILLRASSPSEAFQAWFAVSLGHPSLDKLRLFLHRREVSLSQDGPGKKVLVVGDDEETRHVLRVLCESEELQVVGEAANGVEAVPAALRLQPDFVILDLVPEMDGQRTAEVLRAVAPGARMVAFSVWLEKAPPWADSFLNRERISDLMPLLNAFIR